MIHSAFPVKKRLWSATSLIPGLILCLTALFSASGNSQAQTALSGNLMFILDASGSMELKIKEKTRMEIVRDSLTALVGSPFPAVPNVGMTVFGHRYKGDCNDVEELVPLAPLNKELFVRKLQSVYPAGMTAIAFSILKTSEIMRLSQDQTTLILIADGEDSCNGSPCELVKSLKAEGLKFVMHVIEFDMASADNKQLECMAKAGGGRYFSARNAEDLSRALKKAIETPGLKKGKPAVAAAPAVKPFESASNISEPEKKESPPDFTSPTGNKVILKVDAGLVREQPSIESQVRFRLKKGDRVSVIETKDDWYHIKIDEKRSGWAASRLFSESDLSQAPLPPVPKAEKPVRGNEIKEIRFERGSDRERLVFVQTIGLKPKVFFLKEDIPKIVCDFPGTHPSQGTGKSDILIQGDFIRKIRFGVYSGTEAKLRVVLDLAPGRTYKSEEIFLKETGQYILTVRPAGGSSDNI